MATNSVQYDNYADAIALGIGYANRVSDQGVLRVARFDLEFSASAVGTTLNLCVLPAGAVVLGLLVQYQGTSALTLSIGDADDPDRLAAGMDLATDSPDASSSIATSWFGRLDSTAFGTDGPGGNQNKPNTSSTVGAGYRYTADTVITGLTAGATATAGEVLHGAILYTLN